MAKAKGNLVALQSAPRRSATSRRAGQPCGAPAMRGWSVCYHHGAGGGAPKGERNGQYRHGAHTNEAIAARKLANLLRQLTSDTEG